MSKLQQQTDAWKTVLHDVEKAIYNVKVSADDDVHADVYLKKLQDDLETILEMHNSNLNYKTHVDVARSQAKTYRDKYQDACNDNNS